MYFRKTIFSVALILLAFQTQGQLFINELMSNNQSTIQDADGDYSDWIELYNAGAVSVNLQGYGLSDNPDSLLKYTIVSKNNCCRRLFESMVFRKKQSACRSCSTH
ncbi:MAG: lamin tail domain-containing protein [Bacteroidetes bacterium]|nr:lamin tail domain-containing protein [Bacteroidota bacterium]